MLVDVFNSLLAFILAASKLLTACLGGPASSINQDLDFRQITQGYAPHFRQTFSTIAEAEALNGYADSCKTLGYLGRFTVRNSPKALTCETYFGTRATCDKFHSLSVHSALHLEPTETLLPNGNRNGQLSHGNRRTFHVCL